MYTPTLFIHSLLRWLVLAAGFWAVVRALLGLLGGKPWTAADDKAGRLFTMSMDVQLLIGLLLYGVLSPITRAAFADMGAAMRSGELRYWAVEHIAMMLIAVGLVHVGRSRSRKGTTPRARHRSAVIFFALALAALAAAIPWPFSSNARPLFPF